MSGGKSFGMERPVKIAIMAGIVLLLVGSGIFLLLGGRKGGEPRYNPVNSVPRDFMMITDYPGTEEEMFAISLLTSLQFMGGEYHPLVICSPDGVLSDHELFTLSHLKTDRPKVFFTNRETAPANINQQLSGMGLAPINDSDVHPLVPGIAGTFFGFSGIMEVEDYEESLWAAPYAKNTNMALVPGGRTFETQEQAHNALRTLGIDSGYAVVANPDDHSLETMRRTMDYDPYDDAWFCPDISLMAAQMAAYHDAFVITNTTPLDSTEWVLNLDLSQNRRALGIHEKLRELNDISPLEYIALVGSATALPQFLTQSGGTEGDIVNSDVMYGFLDDDNTYMDAAVGRIIQYDVSLASNQLLKTYLFDDFSDTVTVNYRDVAGGTHEKEWRKHGASFSGFEITYERMQATPGRWICTDFEDAGFTYDYVGPFNTGNKLLDGTINSMENDISEICQGAGYVAYRGHGSDTGSLYGIRVYGPNGEEHQLRYSDCQNMNLPPQLAFFVSCLNGKIYGHGPGTDPASDVEFDKLFTLNYLAAGPAVLVGATEVSFSNIGQDLHSIPAEYLPFIDDHQWDHNDAWYAFVWDGILDHPREHGTIGKAAQWSENRYMNYPPNNQPAPMYPDGEVDWYEVTFFAVYGDPSFRPAVDEMSSPGYDPWHNGPDDM
ncbi:MAG: hypothetical protein DRN57_07055 [Thermoplasmata archaeon]|nr:MAG: hypothetical protein DRN57_07055 [Thermoplasmata archaeon]